METIKISLYSSVVVFYINSFTYSLQPFNKGHLSEWLACALWNPSPSNPISAPYQSGDLKQIIESLSTSASPATKQRWWHPSPHTESPHLQLSSVTQSCLTLCDPVDCSRPGLPVHHQLPELAHTHVHHIGDAIQPSYPLLSPSPPTVNLSQHQVFSNESALCIRWSKYLSFSFSISPSNEYSGTDLL